MQPPLSGPQRGANGDFLLAGGGAGEQQIGEVRAHDQHHHADRECQHQQRRPDAAAHVFGQRHEAAFKIVAVRMGTGHLRGQDLQLGAGTAHRDARFQPRDDGHGVAPAVGFGAEGKREIQIEVAAGGEDRGQVERGGQDSGYRDGIRVDRQCLADNRGIGTEPADPQAMAQQYGARAIPFAFGGSKEPAELRLNPKQREEILRHGHAAETLGLPFAGQQIVADAVEGEVAGHVGIRLIVIPEVEQILHLGGGAREAAGVVVGNPDQPLGFVKRQGAQQQGIDHAENCGAGTNPEPDDKHGEGCESGIAAQCAKRISQILQDGIDHRQTSGVRHVRSCCLYSRAAIWLLENMGAVR